MRSIRQALCLCATLTLLAATGCSGHRVYPEWGSRPYRGVGVVKVKPAKAKPAKGNRAKGEKKGGHDEGHRNGKGKKRGHGRH